MELLQRLELTLEQTRGLEQMCVWPRVLGLTLENVLELVEYELIAHYFLNNPESTK